jgi:hypothetical protein
MGTVPAESVAMWQQVQCGYWYHQQKLRRNSEELLQNSFEEILRHPAASACDVLFSAENFFSVEN